MKSRRKSARVMAVAVGLALPVWALVACGSRTGLLVPSDVTVVEPDGAVVIVTPTDDSSVPPNDATPMIDTFVPDVIPPSICADASNTLIYAVTESNNLLRFDPSSATFSLIGQLQCPDPRSPFSMAVNHAGVGYVLYYDDEGTDGPGSIYRVDLTNAQCEPTAYTPGQGGFQGFGMSFSLATDPDSGLTVETLYVANDNTPPNSTEPAVTGTLGAIDPTSFSLATVGNFGPEVVPAPELTSTSDGRLFAFYAPDGPGTESSVIAQIDKSTAQVIALNALPTLDQGQAWAFGFWGGNFYTFTAPDGTASIVTRYDPNTEVLTQVATYPEPIVGAGVSTCAPAQ